MKHTGRSALALLLALLTAASLAGCGKTGGSGSGGAITDSGSVFSGKTEEPVLIRVAATRLEDSLIVSDTRYGYDESGNKTAEIDYQLGMLLKGYDSYEYEYGSNGLPTKRRAYTTVEGLTQLTAEETFDSSGNVSSRREYDITGDVVAEYTYDSDGNTTLKVSYINGNVSKTETTYYEDSSEMTVRDTKPDGSSQYWEYLPKEDGIGWCPLKARTETDANGNETRYDYTLEKDENGKILRYSAVNAATGELDFRQDYVNVYGDNGKPTSIEVTDENGVCIQRESFRYDENDNLIYEEDMRDINDFFTQDTFTFAYNDAGTRIQTDYTHYQKNRKGVTMETSYSIYYDDQGDMNGYYYEEEQGYLSFEIGRVAGKQVMLNKRCMNLNENSQFDFDMVFTGDNKFTRDYSHYFSDDLAYDALDYTRSYTYDDKGNLTAIEEWENGAETPTQRWDYTYAMPKAAPAPDPQTVHLTLGNCPTAVRLYDANDTLRGESFLTYGEDGRRTEMVTDGVSYSYQYEDEADGSYTANQYASDGSISQKLRYDQQGNLLEETQLGGTIPTFREYAYDALGNQQYGSLWGIGSGGYYAYEYDESCHPTALLLYGSYSYEPGTLIERAVCTCDDSGRLTRLEVYDASGTLEGYVTYEYAG